MPAVAFVTAHDQYAIRAFEINAIDYLLKPITGERFVQSLARAKVRLPPANRISRTKSSPCSKTWPPLPVSAPDCGTGPPPSRLCGAPCLSGLGERVCGPRTALSLSLSLSLSLFVFR